MGKQVETAPTAAAAGPGILGSAAAPPVSFLRPPTGLCGRGEEARGLSLPDRRAICKRCFGPQNTIRIWQFYASLCEYRIGASLVTSAMPCHRPRHFALVGRRAGRQAAVPLGHALVEHEIGWHSDLGAGILPADLLHHGRVVVGLARPLRERGGTCAQKDNRCETQRAAAHNHYRTLRSQDAI